MATQGIRSNKATRRQLAYLRALADRTGQTFAYPKTLEEASAEIDRLKHTRPSTRTERRVERKLIADQIATGPIDAARVTEHEISGHGSSATWTQNREHDPPPVEDPSPAESRRRRGPVVGKRTELARYTLPDGTERVLVGQRVEGVVRLSDCPNAPGGRAYLIERELEQDGRSALNALIIDYLAQAKKLAAIPMTVTPLKSYLEQPQ